MVSRRREEFKCSCLPSVAYGGHLDGAASTQHCQWGEGAQRVAVIASWQHCCDSLHNEYNNQINNDDQVK